MPTDLQYPTQLPKPAAKFTVKKDKGVISTKFASGRLRQRNAYNDLRRPAKITIEMDQRDFDLFQGWWTHTLSNGASDFNMSLFIDADGYHPYVVTPVDGKYSSAHYGVGYWRVSFDALVLSQNYTSAEVVELFLHWGDTPDEMLTASDPLDELINTTLPNYFGA
jgi:hypothetical protein